MHYYYRFHLDLELGGFLMEIVFVVLYCTVLYCIENPELHRYGGEFKLSRCWSEKLHGSEVQLRIKYVEKQYYYDEICDV